MGQSVNQSVNQKYALHWFQTVELLSSSYLPLIFWYFPRVAVEYSGLDAVWAVFGVIIAGLLVAAIHVALNEKFPYQSGAIMLNMTFGKWLAKVVAMIYLSTYLLYCALCVYFFVAMLRPFHLYTPRSVMLVALCLVAAYGATRGVEALARVSTGVHLLALIGLIVASVLTLIEADWYWRPLPPLDWSSCFRGVFHLLPLYFGFSLFLMLNPYYEHKPRRSMMYAALSMAKAGVILMATFAAVLARFGWEGTEDLTYPVASMIQLIRLNGWIIERIGIFAVSIAVAFTVLFLSNHIWALSTLTAESLNWSGGKFIHLTWPIAAIIVTIALVIPDDQTAGQIVTIFLTPMSWVVLIGIPFLVLVLGVVRKRLTP